MILPGKEKENMLQEKQMIENKYEVRKKLNDNGLYMVTDLRMMTLWMVKEISWKEMNEKFINGENNQETIIVELEQLKKINHRIFPKIVEILRAEEALYVVMEPVHGKPVQEEKRRPEEIVTWAVQLCDGLKNTGQIEAAHIRWKHGTEDIRQEDGNIRLWDFEIFSQEESSEAKELKEIAEFIRDMIGKKLKMSGKLKNIVQSCISGNGEYETYESLAETLERYVMEDKKRKKFKKQFCSAGAIVAIAAVLVFSGNQILKSRKTVGQDNKPEENPVETIQPVAMETKQEKPAEDTQETRSEGIEKTMTAYAGEVMKKFNQQKAENRQENGITEEKEENKQTDVIVAQKAENNQQNAMVAEKEENKQSDVIEKQEEEKTEESNQVPVFKTIKPIVIPTSVPEPKERTEKTKEVVKASEVPQVQTQKTEKSVAAQTKTESQTKPKSQTNIQSKPKTQPNKKASSKPKTPEIKISKPKKKKVPQNAEIELEDNDMEIVVE